MSPRRHTRAARLAAVLLLVAGGSAVAAGSAAATTLPLPSPTTLANPLDGAVLGDAVTQTQETVQGPVTGLLPTSPPAATSGGDTSTGASTSQAPTPTEPDASGATAPTGTTRARSAQQAPAAASSPAGVRAVTPAASVCLIPTGGASLAFEVGLDVVGQDLSSPLVKQFPQAFAACPAGAVRVDGDTVAGVDARVQGLLGACVRVTRQVAPLETTLVVLDHDLIRELTAVGVPLEQLVVPCPTAGAATPGADDPAGAGTSDAAAQSSSGAGAASARPARLAFTGTEPGPVLFAAVTLLCAGALLVRKARLLAAGARG